MGHHASQHARRRQERLLSLSSMHTRLDGGVCTLRQNLCAAVHPGAEAPVSLSTCTRAVRADDETRRDECEDGSVHAAPRRDQICRVAQRCTRKWPGERCLCGMVSAARTCCFWMARVPMRAHGGHGRASARVGSTAAHVGGAGGVRAARAGRCRWPLQPGARRTDRNAQGASGRRNNVTRVILIRHRFRGSGIKLNLKNEKSYPWSHVCHAAPPSPMS